MTALSLTTNIAYEAGRKHMEMTTMMAVVKPSMVCSKMDKNNMNIKYNREEFR